MADSRREKNWYIVLELEFDPPVVDEKEIADRIADKKKFWSRNFDNFKEGAQYRIWHGNISQIRRDMLGPANKRKELSEEACNIIYGPVEEDLKQLEKNGEITADEGKKIAECHGVSIEKVKARAAKLGISIKWDENVSLEHYQEIYRQYYEYRPDNALVFDNMEPMLKSFGVDNLYDFLCADSEAKDRKPNKLSCEDLREKISEKKKRFNKNDSISSNGLKLCGHCEDAFRNEGSRDDYDRYLAYKRRRKILDEARRIAEMSSENGLRAEQGKKYIDQLTQILEDSKLSREVFVAFCRVEKIYYDEQEKPREPESGKEPSEEKKPNDSGNFGNKEPYDIDFSGFGAMSQRPIIPEESEESGNSGNQAPLYGGYGKSPNTNGEGTPIGPSGPVPKVLIIAGCVCAVLIGIIILVGLLSFIPELIMDRTEKKSETVLADDNDRFEKFADGSAAESTAEEAADELAADIPAEEAAPAEEAPAAAEEAGEPTENRDDFTDEEWFLTTVRVDGGYDLPHGFTREDIRWDNAVYVAAGGSYYSDPLKGQLIRNLRLWAQKKEEVEGDGYWADEHLEGIHDSFDVESALYQNLLLLNNKAIVRYAREVMDSSIWEELRSYVGDEEADRIDQDMYERIQSEEDIFARMPQN